MIQKIRFKDDIEKLLLLSVGVFFRTEVQEDFLSPYL
jgi:hypothetical protein